VIRLTEGKKHEIKRLFAHFDLQVKRLLRVAIGPVTLGSLPPGVIERLSEQETAEIFRSIR
jgi:23S rRNA pseudouridine2605 synthase